MRNFVRPALLLLLACNAWPQTATITERVRLQLRGEAFNVFNSPMFSNPSANFSNLATFGDITSTSVDNRVMQLGGKLVF